MITLPAQPRILVVTLRRLGDVLVTTPLIRSLKRTRPESAIDAFVFADTAGMLEGNPDVERVIATSRRPPARELLSTLRPLWRQYDLAVAVSGSDREIFVAWAAGLRRVGLVFRRDSAGALRSLALDDAVRPRIDPHRVNLVLLLADAVGAARCAEIVVPRSAVRPGLIPEAPFAVIHVEPGHPDRRWTVAGWRAVATELARRGLALVATGGGGEQEQRYLDEVWSGPTADVRRLDGRLRLGEMSALLSSAGVYVGPDTSVTHLAAACGCPTVALFGPTEPQLWGPWPATGLDEPWRAQTPLQRRGNVWMVQAPLSRRENRADEPAGRWLAGLPVTPVLAAMDEALNASAAAGLLTASAG